MEMVLLREAVRRRSTSLILEGKKKVQQEEYYSVTMLAIGMKDTIMTMTREEVERFLQEPRGERPTT